MTYNDRVQNFERLARTFIKRKGLEDLLQYLHDSDFYFAPCSTKYHLSREGGLAEHSINVCNQLFTEVASHNITGYTDETIAIVSLFHDLCKIGCYKIETAWRKDKNGQWELYNRYVYDEDYPFGHSEKSAIILQRWLDCTPLELQAINAHMGFSDSRGAQLIGNIFNKNKLALLLHFADMTATYLMERDEDA